MPALDLNACFTKDRFADTSSRVNRGVYETCGFADCYRPLRRSSRLRGAFAPVRPKQPVQTVQLSYGRGLGVRRGPLGACTPVYLYEGFDPYYRGYVRGYHDGRRGAAYPCVRYDGGGDVIAVDRGFCAFGSYLSCSYGTCWRAYY